MNADLRGKKVEPQEGTKRAKKSMHSDFGLCLLCLFVADLFILDPCHPRLSAAYSLIPRMVLSLGVTLELRVVEIHFPQFAGAVAFRLVIEVRRRRVAAFAPGGHGSRSNGLAEFDDGHEALAARTVNFL